MTAGAVRAVRAVRTAGDTALLVEVAGGPAAPARFAAAVRTALPGHLTDTVHVVPAAQTVLVLAGPGRGDTGRGHLDELARLIRDLGHPGPAEDGAAGAEEPDGPYEPGEPGEPGVPDDLARQVAEIPVRYDGPDLADVAELAGLSAEDVIAAHSAAEYVVGWLGFSPGFAYLTGLDPALHVPRLPSPRTAVPVGSVAIAGPLAAVYPSPSPGGWRLLGRTSARLWDPARDPPAALLPGMRVRFRPVRDLAGPDVTARADVTAGPGVAATAGPIAARPPEGPKDFQDRRDPRDPRGRVVEVVQPGPLATVQDLGRPRYGHLGVPRSGAADAGSLRLANRLVGNPEDAAALELTLGGAALRFRSAAWVAITGAPVRAGIGPGGAAARIGDRSGMGVPFLVPAGALLTLSAPTSGLRSYLAVRGGVDVPPVLGSRSSDALSRLGPAPLHPGDALPLGGTSECGPIVADLAPLPAPRAGAARLRVIRGPRDDWFTGDALGILCTAEYEVTGDSDRSGLRLSGPVLPRSREGELPSEGMVAGALQVPPDGRPILFLADHPVTGGYPVIAVVVSADVDRAAQLRPGDKIHFTPVRSPLS